MVGESRSVGNLSRSLQRRGPSYNEKRAILSPKKGGIQRIIGRSPILKPLMETNGLIFPYTPTINDTVSVNYEAYEPTHSNQSYLAFKNRGSKEISIIGTFTSMNQVEARTNLANLHFLRLVTMMDFGSQSPNAGTPPPVLSFSAYGSAVFNNVPVIVTNYSFEMPADVDYVYCNGEPPAVNPIAYEFSGGDPDGEYKVNGLPTDYNAWMPTRFTITIQMTVQHTPSKWRNTFNINDFRDGKLLNGGWV